MEMNTGEQYNPENVPDGAHPEDIGEVEASEATPEATSEATSEAVDEAIAEATIDDDPETSPEETETKKKPKKGKALLAVLIPVGVVLVSLGVLVLLFGKKTLTYLNATEKMRIHAYDAAYDGFASIGAFLDAEEKANECKYASAVRDYNKGVYVFAKEKFSELGDYSDAKAFAEKCVKPDTALSDVLNAIYSGDYQKAQNKLSAVSSKQTNKTYLMRVIQYLSAEKELKDGEYVEAIWSFGALESFSDAKLKMSEAKFKYTGVASNKENNAYTVYTYLQELIDENYPGAKARYDQYYTLKLKMYYNTTANGKDSQTSLSRNNPVYCHFVVSGCKPNGSAHLYWITTYSDGTTYERRELGYYGNDEDGYVYWEKGPGGRCSWVQIAIYLEDGTEVGRARVNLY